MKIFADFSFLMKLLVICVIIGFLTGLFVSAANHVAAPPPSGLAALVVYGVARAVLAAP